MQLHPTLLDESRCGPDENGTNDGEDDADGADGNDIDIADDSDDDLADFADDNESGAEEGVENDG